MRYNKEAKITLSVDDLASPKQIRMQDTQSITEIVLIKEARVNTETIPALTTDYVLSLGQVVTPKWLYLLGDKTFSAKINDGPSLSFSPNKPNELWCAFTSVKISTGSEAVNLTWGIGGE
jgi:hypothetical protein